MNELFFQELAKVLHDVLDEHRKRQDERIGMNMNDGSKVKS